MNLVWAMTFSILVGSAPEDLRMVAPGERVPNLAVRTISDPPVRPFECGRVYVLEFWSTWCGACVEPIDMLNVLSRRYEKDATFIAVHVWPQPTAPRPNAFLKSLTDAGKPVYAFAVAEDVDGIVARAWLDATETTGLPTAMIIDRQSQLAWIGHAKDLEQALAPVVAGTFDHAVGVAEMKRRIRVGRLARESGQAIDAGAFERGIELILQALVEDPATVTPWIPSTYGHLLAVSRQRAIAAGFVARVEATAVKIGPDILAGFAQVILHFDPTDLRDLELAAALAERADRMTGSSDSRILHTLALVRMERGDFPGAKQALERALEMAPDETTRSRLTDSLERLTVPTDH